MKMHSVLLIGVLMCYDAKAQLRPSISEAAIAAIRETATAGDVLSIKGAFPVSGRILKAKEIVFQSGASITFSADVDDWVAIVAETIKVADPDESILITTRRAPIPDFKFKELGSGGLGKALLNQCSGSTLSDNAIAMIDLASAAGLPGAPKHLLSDRESPSYWQIRGYPIYRVPVVAPPKQPKSQGGNGAPGLPGQDGFTAEGKFCPGRGLDGRTPPSLYLIVGALQNKAGAAYPRANNFRFDVRGQDGQRGPDGLDGGPGGIGGDGEDGSYDLLKGCTRSPGAGGARGAGGRAGKGLAGGDGSPGGAIYLFAPSGRDSPLDSLKYSEILNTPGRGGMPGKHGKQGVDGGVGAHGSQPGTCVARVRVRSNQQDRPPLPQAASGRTSARSGLVFAPPATTIEEIKSLF